MRSAAFHTALFTTGIQPDERGTSFPDNAKLIEIAREAGVVGKVPDCVNSGKYLSKVTAEAAAANITATPTIKINGDNYDPSTPDALVAKIKSIVGDVPGIDTRCRSCGIVTVAVSAQPTEQSDLTPASRVASGPRPAHGGC